MKEGKLKTLLIEDIKDLKASLLDFDGDVEAIAIIPSAGADMTDIKQLLQNLTLYKVLAKPDPNLKEASIELDYHAIDPIKVTDINLTDPDNLILNGKIKIPWSAGEDIGVVGGYFLDEEIATTICREINIHTAERVRLISAAMIKSLKFRTDIAENAMT